MEKTRTIFVLALGRGYEYRAGQPVGICSAGKIRANLALKRARAYYFDVMPYVTVYLAATAGREASRTEGPTMAQLTGHYFDAEQVEVPTIINRNDVGVWGTFAEIEWLVHKVHELTAIAPYQIEVVAAPRQALRTRVMCRWFFPNEPITVITSDEAPIPLYHECLGYLKLAVYALGGRRAADWFRQKTARPIKEQQ